MSRTSEPSKHCFFFIPLLTERHYSFPATCLRRQRVCCNMYFFFLINFFLFNSRIYIASANIPHKPTMYQRAQIFQILGGTRDVWKKKKKYTVCFLTNFINDSFEYRGAEMVLSIIRPFVNGYFIAIFRQMKIHSINEIYRLTWTWSSKTCLELWKLTGRSDESVMGKNYMGMIPSIVNLHWNKTLPLANYLFC